MKCKIAWGKRWLSLVLVFSLLLGCVPLGALATEAPEEMTEASAEDTEALAEVTEDPSEVTEAPTEVTEALTEVTEAPTEVTEDPVETTEAPVEVEEALARVGEAPKLSEPLAGKTLSILGASISTFAGTSNGAAADTTNSTIRNNAKYYPHNVVSDVALADTWWMQAASDLGLRLLVNNAWSGSALLHERNGTVGAYVDRCVQLHDDTGDNAGETPDIIAIQMGTNDFQYYKDTLGTADIDYAALIKANADGSFSYAQPTTSLEAAAIVLHKISVRYPQAEVYYLNISQRIDGTDDLIRSFNAELKQVVEHFGAHIVDIYGSAITMDAFAAYIGDGKAHPNRLGMDAYTEAFKRSLLANTEYLVTAHRVSLNLEGVTADYGDDKLVVSGNGFSLNLRASDPMEVTVTMGGGDITASVYDAGKVSIPSVTGDVTVTAKAVFQPKTYRWEFDGTDLAGSNTLTKFSGTTTDGVFSKTGYALAEDVILKHDLPWEVEWKCAGTFQNENGSSGARIFTSDKVNANYHARYIFKSNTAGILAMGEKDAAGSHNYGIALADHGIDWTAEHIYRMENRIAADGTNMVYLHVDGVEIGPMVNYYIGTRDQGTTSHWLSGKDFRFPYMGTDTHGFTNCSIEYIAVREGGHTHGYRADVTAPTCTAQGYTTYTCDCGESYVGDYTEAALHDWENGVCGVCGDTGESLALRYDDRYDITGKTVEILDAGTPTSFQVGYGVEENALPDTAVVELRDNCLVATGIGTARVMIDDIPYEITVTAAPINLLLLIGQSNMEGNEGEAKQSISCPDGMVYATYGDRYDMVLENATHYAPSALTGQYRNVNTVGGTDGLSDYPVYMLTYEGDGRKGPDSGFAYEWVQQTGEKVWIVNASHGGTSLNVWQPGTTQYEECQAMFGACAETLRKEIAAGHFTLNHMAYFWCQGCNDYDKTAKWYVENYLSMHESLKRELAFDHDSDAATPDRTFEYGGIIPVRTGHSWRTCYRDGIYPQANPYSYYESYQDLRLSGPRVAQYWMTNNPELPELWNVCTIGEDWVWMPDGTNGVTEYFRAHYPNGTVDYDPQVKQAASWYTPTTPNAVHDSIHYNQIGYNEVGREAVRNALILMGLKPDYEAQTTVTFVNWTGYETAETVPASTQGRSGTLVVPIIKPVTRTKTVQFALSEGLRWDYYDLLADSVQREGQLTAHTGETVDVVKQAPGEYIADHLRQLPEELCRGVNLWNVLERDSQYFTANGWGKHTSGQVYSLTIPVKAGDRIWATSFGPAGENGNNANGIRCTFFGEYEVIRTMTPAEVYGEFAEKGYLTAPKGAIAVNVPMWNTEDTNELYLLSVPHEGSESICGICGKNSHEHSWSDWETVTLPSQSGPGIESRSCACGSRESREVSGVWQTLELGKYLVSLPESHCGGTDLWPLLPHTQTYFHSGTHWDVNTAADVWAVTVPLSPGDRIWATSFGAAGENNHTSAGIRVTFFDVYGIAKTLSPAETYAEFRANGYLTAPEGTVAVNVPMYGDEGNELYLLSAPHRWVEETAAIRSCGLCGGTEGGYRIDVTGEEVWIDGVKHIVREDRNGKFVLLEGTNAQTLTVYSYNEAAASDSHAKYPTGMRVWMLTFENGGYVSTYVPEFENLLQYAGSSIRVTGVKGIRIITGIHKALRQQMMDGSLGYTLVEYGTCVAWADDLKGSAPMLGQGSAMHNYAYKQGVADPIFADTGSTIQYTNVLVGFTDDQLGSDLVMRPYIILEDSDGQQLTIYGGCVQRSIGYIARQNQNTFPEGTKADAYIEDIISKVYG